MTVRLLCLLILAAPFLSINYSYSQDVISATESDMNSIYQQNPLTIGDSCSVLNPERHDGFVHTNGFSQTADTLRFLISFHPQVYPWVYSKVCIGLFKLSSGSSTLNYNVIIYDSSASGNPGNLLYFSPVQTATSIPNFPLVAWYSATLDQVAINSGAVYIGIQFHNQPAQQVYLAVDYNANTPQWDGYYAVNGSYPAVWQPVVNYPPFSTYRCFAVRTEGFLFNGIQNNNSQVPTDYYLNQNYPNPFNPSTAFNFGVPKAGVVRLAVYDMLGREAAGIVNDFMKAGNYTVTFDASQLSSGVYFYKLVAGDFVDTKKMVLIK